MTFKSIFYVHNLGLSLDGPNIRRAVKAVLAPFGSLFDPELVSAFQDAAMRLAKGHALDAATVGSLWELVERYGDESRYCIPATFTASRRSLSIQTPTSRANIVIRGEASSLTVTIDFGAGQGWNRRAKIRSASVFEDGSHILWETTRSPSVEGLTEDWPVDFTDSWDTPSGGY